MNKTFYLYLGAAIIVIIYLILRGEWDLDFIWRITSPQAKAQPHISLLRGELDQVEKVKVIYYGDKQGKLDYQSSDGAITVLSIEKDRGLISELYKKVISTKRVRVYTNPDELESQESDPLFEIFFIYKNGESDKIESIETGRQIFRRLSEFGWVGGPCPATRKDLLPIVRELFSTQLKPTDKS